MLSEGQRDNIRLAYRAAERSGNDTVLQNRVRQLSRDFGISENEVRGIAKGAISEPAKAAGPAAKGSAAHGRSEWTPEQVRRLVELHNQGKGPAAIAREMGCNVGRVTAKLHGLRKSGVLAAPTIAPLRPRRLRRRPKRRKRRRPRRSLRDSRFPASARRLLRMGQRGHMRRPLQSCPSRNPPASTWRKSSWTSWTTSNWPIPPSRGCCWPTRQQAGRLAALTLPAGGIPSA